MPWLNGRVVMTSHSNKASRSVKRKRTELLTWAPRPWEQSERVLSLNRTFLRMQQRSGSSCWRDDIAWDRKELSQEGKLARQNKQTKIALALQDRTQCCGAGQNGGAGLGSEGGSLWLPSSIWTALTAFSVLSAHLAQEMSAPSGARKDGKSRSVLYL